MTLHVLRADYNKHIRFWAITTWNDVTDEIIEHSVEDTL